MVVCCGFGVSSKHLGQLMFWAQKRRRRVHCVCAPIWPSTTGMAKRATLWNLDRNKIWEIGTSNKRAEPHLERVVSINEGRIHDHFFLSKFLTITHKPARNSNDNTTTFDFFFIYFFSFSLHRDFYSFKQQATGICRFETEGQSSSTAPTGGDISPWQSYSRSRHSYASARNTHTFLLTVRNVILKTVVRARVRIETKAANTHSHGFKIWFL